MCGIIGIVGNQAVTDRLIEGLKRLEYRGYDSAGIAIMENAVSGSVLSRRRAEGKIHNLVERVAKEPVDGNLGIAHTRWATHGIANENNAHPHFAGRVGLVHNGIIENFTQLRDGLKKVRKFQTQTDTEVVAHLIDEAMKNGASAQEAFAKTIGQLTGAFALGVVIEGEDQQLFAARRGSPLAIGLGDGENYIGSDAIALASLSQKIIYLEEGDWAVLTTDSVKIFDADNAPVERPITMVSGSLAAAEKGNYKHYMLKEIYEQPETVGRTLTHYIDAFNHRVKTPEELELETLDFKNLERVTLIACGTAAYAAYVAKYWFEQLADLPTDVDIASEFRYRRPALSQNSMAIAVSQSGETADTLAALRYCQKKGLKTAALVNQMTSTMARESDYAMPINAGPEIGVASTKAFTSQLTALLSLAISSGVQRGHIDKKRETELTDALTQIPRLITETLALEPEIETLAHDLSKTENAFYMGRGVHFPLALEGALKLKEISYIHAEGYAAGELKHGPIALIEEGTPVVVIAPYDELFEKTVSNMQEVATRGAKITLITDEKGAAHTAGMAHATLVCPETQSESAPIVYAIPIQLLAYHAAVHLGTDVDQPRNLAKSVTVE
ncbi:MAG: glutamine--fructose-6-phosphate transaminase (isomerizing) [Acidimicrobiales bacterium]|nr:glutamine--fructose-6-phosphate transaminase (isomerizing) [Hyphomonadaceae bacterium]RZV36311.1 MAG: glutamine--fructose-6-phosphate transaminase (isomerizing) [Acidimicrobiales bacterium]